MMATGRGVNGRVGSVGVLPRLLGVLGLALAGVSGWHLLHPQPDPDRFAPEIGPGAPSFVERLFLARETNRFFRTQALPPILDLDGIGQKWWAVGPGGVILHSADDGRTWDRQSFEIEATGTPGAQASPGLSAQPQPQVQQQIQQQVTAPTAGIEPSEAAGAAGGALSPPLPLHWVQALDENVVWAASDGYVLRTENGGASWVARPIIADGEKGFIQTKAEPAIRAGADGVFAAINRERTGIFWTDDSGETWNFFGRNMIEESDTGNKREFSFPIVRIFLSPDNSIDFTTLNGGKSFLYRQNIFSGVSF